MSVRESLLRLYRWRLQERQDYLAGLESLAARLRSDARHVEEEASEGARAVAFAREAGADYPPLIRPLIDRQRKIERSILEVERQIDEARVAVTAALQEVKHSEAAVGPQTTFAAAQPGRRTRRKRPVTPLGAPFADRAPGD